MELVLNPKLIERDPARGARGASTPRAPGSPPAGSTRRVSNSWTRPVRSKTDHPQRDRRLSRRAPSHRRDPRFPRRAERRAGRDPGRDQAHRHRRGCAHRDDRSRPRRRRAAPHRASRALLGRAAAGARRDVPPPARAPQRRHRTVLGAPAARPAPAVRQQPAARARARARRRRKDSRATRRSTSASPARPMCRPPTSWRASRSSRTSSAARCASPASRSGAMTRHWAICTGAGAGAETLREARDARHRHARSSARVRTGRRSTPRSRGSRSSTAATTPPKCSACARSASMSARSFGIPSTFIHAPTGL